jgi:two-component system phosphate regulon sensor histidine kinase PhoR
MSVEISTPPAFDWSDRLRRATVILLAAALVLGVLVVGADVSLIHAIVAFVVIGAAALVPWRLNESRAASEPVPIDPAETEIVRALIGGMPDPAVLLDRAGRVLHLNAAAAELMPALRRGEPAQFALRQPEILSALREALAGAASRRVDFLDRGPVERWMDLSIAPIAVPTAFGGRGLCMLMTFHDQTPLRRVEEMRADFIANASHELRTPLAALSGFIDTMRGPARDDAQARERFLGIMHAQAGRMARLIDDLLSLSRVELAAHRVPTEIVDLRPILRQVVDGLEPLAAERGVVIALETPQTPLDIAGDREELLRLFENLIENALKYGATGERVEVSHRPGSDVRIAVRDHGPGIAPEHLPRLTERFYRVDIGDSRAQGGTGLGLALVKHILARHRGKLTIESVQGQGATFTAIFPPAKAPDQS